MQRYQRGLCGWEHEATAFILSGFQPINVILELGELTRGKTALVAKHVRNQHQIIAVSNMEVHEIVEDRPLQTRAKSGIDPESVSGELDTALVVDQTQIGAEIHVVLRLEIKFTRLAVVTQRLVIFLAACRQIHVGQIGQTQHEGGELCFHFLELVVVCRYLCAKLLHGCKDRGKIFSFLFI